MSNSRTNKLLQENKLIWPFCYCGTILDPPEFEEIMCTYCGFKAKFNEVLPQVGLTVTTSASTQVQSWAKDTSKPVAGGDKMDKHAIIEEPCSKCGHPELYFYTMQLRSVDEGSTVFYECPKCAFKYSQNN